MIKFFVAAFAMSGFSMVASADIVGFWEHKDTRCSSGTAYSNNEDKPSSFVLEIGPSFVSAEVHYDARDCVIYLQPFAYSVSNGEIVPANSVGTTDVICGGYKSTSTTTLHAIPFQLNEPNLITESKGNGCPAGDGILDVFSRR